MEQNSSFCDKTLAMEGPEYKHKVQGTLIGMFMRDDIPKSSLPATDISMFRHSQLR